MRYVAASVGTDTHTQNQSTFLNGNRITLYADGMLWYRIINELQDFSCVQQDIDNVGRWVTTISV